MYKLTITFKDDNNLCDALHLFEGEVDPISKNKAVLLLEKDLSGNQEIALNSDKNIIDWDLISIEGN